jgi:hypothetical protein
MGAIGRPFCRAASPYPGRPLIFCDGIEERREHVGVVVAVLALQHGTMRSKPMPVSTCLAGRGVSLPSGPRLNWINTRFQISITRASSALTRSPPFLSGVRSMWISLHGPQGPLSPISQKLSFLLPRTDALGGQVLRPQVTASSSGSSAFRRLALKIGGVQPFRDRAPHW